MLRPRIIPCLLVHQKGLVKTVNFKNHKYVGDPINAVRIFNEKQVDELMVLDIDATVEKREPDYQMIENIASECRMPLCYGGGVKSPEQAQRIFSLGVEKIAFSSAIVETPDLVRELAERVGSQSVVAVVDVKKKLFGGYQVYTRNGAVSAKYGPAELIRKYSELGAGEIVVNSIDHDGKMEGYDLALVDLCRAATDKPMTILGGAGSLNHIGQLISKHGIIGAAAGSLFVFKGPYRAVLISYPTPSEKRELLMNSMGRQSLV
jgi:cyclase